MMAARIFKRLSVKTPAELAQKAHQAFVRLPYESSQDKLVEEIARLLAGIKVNIFLPPPACLSSSSSLFAILFLSLFTSANLTTQPLTH